MNNLFRKFAPRVGVSAFTVMLGIVLVGCGDAFNDVKLRQAVIDEFQTADVALAPGKSYTFIVRTPDGAVWIAETMGSSVKVTAKALLFAARK